MAVSSTTTTPGNVQGVTVATVDAGAVPHPPRPPVHASTVRIGRTLTGPPGAPARVANLGDPRNVLLAFSIPQGREGHPGIRGYPGDPGPPGPQGPPGGAASAGPTAPVGPENGELWFDTASGILYIWANGAWQPVSSQALPVTQVTGTTALPSGVTGVVSIAAPASVTVTVPPGTIPGQQVTLKDVVGNAGTNVKTIICQPTVDGNPFYQLVSNYASVTIFWMGSQWGTM